MVGVKNASGTAIRWACPRCRGQLNVEEGGYRCLRDDLFFAPRDGIWRFLLPERKKFYAQFIDQYQQVRCDEGWGADEAAYYRALPFADPSRRHTGIWRIRARSFETLLKEVVDSLAAKRTRPLKIVDLGAGNGWLSYRLAKGSHQLMAVDLLTNRVDGLRAHSHYDVPFTPVQAEFDRLPIDFEQADLVIYNGALHYSTSYRRTLTEGLRILRADGRIVIMDSPIYQDPASGDRMVQERQEQFARFYGFTVPALPSKGYLTLNRLASLASELALQWTYLDPGYGWRWKGRQWLSKLRSRREPATFLVVVGRRKSAAVRR